MVSVVVAQVPSQWVRYPDNIGYFDAITLKEILEKLDALDKKLGAADCSKDADKVPFMKQLDERIKRLEAIAKKSNP
jgi:hypothetical protein